MEMFLQVIILVAGFVLLIKGADWLISGASSVAQNFKVSKMLIGLTIIALVPALQSLQFLFLP